MTDKDFKPRLKSFSHIVWCQTVESQQATFTKNRRNADLYRSI